MAGRFVSIREWFAFGLRRPEEKARAAISCRKSETQVSLPHEQSVLFACQIVGPPFRRLFRDRRSASKNSLLKISCNPLISQDSSERIQGNPRKTNPQKLGFRGETATFQENANQVDEGRRSRLDPNVQRFSLVEFARLRVDLRRVRLRPRRRRGRGGARAIGADLVALRSGRKRRVGRLPVFAVLRRVGAVRRAFLL